MATELTWASDVNRTVADQSTTQRLGQWELWYLVESLKGSIGGLTSGLWTTYYSCNGTTAGTANDGVDRWSTTFTAANLVRNSSTSGARSWFVLKSPDALGPIYMTVDYIGANDSTAAFYFSKSAPTGGSTTARPTATDEWGYTAHAFTDNSIANNHRVNMHLSSRGDWWFGPTRNGLANFYAAFSCFKLQETASADLHPAFTVFVDSNALSSGTGFLANPSPDSTATVGGNTNTRNKARNFDGSALPTWFLAVPASAWGITVGSSVLTTGNSSAANVSDGTYNDFPCYVLGVNPHAEKKGRLPDVLWASATPAVGSTRPASTPYEYVKIGQMWWPWVSSSSPTL